MPKSLTRAEQETILRWDAEDKTVLMYTASPFVAEQWRKKGYEVESRHLGWWAKGPAGCVTVRRRQAVGQKLPKNRAEKLAGNLRTTRQPA